MTEELPVKPASYGLRAFLYGATPPEPQEGDVLLYQGELLTMPEPVAAEFLGVPLPLGEEDGFQGDTPPTFEVDGKRYTTASAAAVDFVLNRTGGLSNFAERIREVVTVVRRRTYDSAETPEALQLVAGRREEQNRVHGGAAHDDTHTLADWREYMQDYFIKIELAFEEVGNLGLPLSGEDDFNNHILDKATDIAALGVAMLETALRASRRPKTNEKSLVPEGPYSIEGKVDLSDGDEVVDPQGLKLTPYSELKDKYVGEPGSYERRVFDEELTKEIEESSAHQERLLGLKQIDSEEDYKAVMQLLGQMTDCKHGNLAEMEHLGNIANAYENANGHELTRQAIDDAIFEAREAANRAE
jgi:hypothetical protein